MPEIAKRGARVTGAESATRRDDKVSALRSPPQEGAIPVQSSIRRAEPQRLRSSIRSDLRKSATLETVRLAGLDCESSN